MKLYLSLDLWPWLCSSEHEGLNWPIRASDWAVKHLISSDQIHQLFNKYFRNHGTFSRTFGKTTELYFYTSEDSHWDSRFKINQRRLMHNIYFIFSRQISCLMVVLPSATNQVTENMSCVRGRIFRRTRPMKVGPFAAVADQSPPEEKAVPAGGSEMRRSPSLPLLLSYTAE